MLTADKKEFFRKYHDLTEKEYNLELLYSLKKTRYKLEKIKVYLSFIVFLFIVCLLILIINRILNFYI